MERVELGGPDGTCWQWTGHLSVKGYGLIRVPGRKKRPIHRVAWEWVHGPIPPGLMIDHLCRNRGCVNTKHLRVVTPRVNTLENSVSFAAVNAQKTHCDHGHPFNRTNTYWRPKGKGRDCRVCRVARIRRFKARAKTAAPAA